MKTSTDSFVDLFRDLYDKDVLVISCGPSMKRWKEIYEKFPNDKKPYLICIKQSICDVDVPCDLHVFNHCNLIKYKYKNKPVARVFGVSELMKSRFWFVPREYTYFVNDTSDFNNSLSSISDPEVFYKKIKLTGHQIWGPGIMYEFVMPLLLTAKVKSITTIGWDIASSDGKNIHYFDDKIETTYDQSKCYKQHLSFLNVKATTIFKSLHRIKSLIVSVIWFLSFIRHKKINVVSMAEGEAELVAKGYYTLCEACKIYKIKLNVISDSVWFK